MMRKVFRATLVDRIKAGASHSKPLVLLTYETDASVTNTQAGDLLEYKYYEKAPRQYSLAGVAEGRFQLLVRDTGVTGAALANLPLETVSVFTHLGGVFHPGRGIWLSRGSGAAPFRDAITRNIFPYVWTCEVDDLNDRTEVYATSELVEPGSFFQRISRGLSIGSLERRFREFPDASPYFVCGSSEYVSEISARLVEKGVNPLNIRTDTFSGAED